MILDTLRLHPFAACHDETYTFEAGLNVVLGPNEAGKSTLWHAILALLGFADNAREYDESLRRRYLPLGGTDHLQITLGARLPDRRIEAHARVMQGGTKAHLELRTWPLEGPEGMPASRPSAHLINPQAVRDELGRIRRYSQRVYEEVLMISAAGLAVAARSQGGALRDTVGKGASDLIERVREGQQAGVGRIGRLRPESALADLDHLLNSDAPSAYPGRWDFARQQPESGRGIDNPWQKNVGLILASWYRWQEAVRARDTARENLERLERLEGELARTRAAQAEARAALAAEGATERYQAARRLRDMEAQRARLSAELELARHRARQQAERDAALGAALTERDQTRIALERHVDGQGEVLLAGHLRQLREVLAFLKPRVAAYQQAVRAANAIAVPVSSMTVKMARDLEGKIREAQTRISVAKGLKVTLRAQMYEGVKAQWQPVGGAARTLNLTTEPLTLELEGATRLSTPELEVTLSAQAAVDLEALTDTLESTRRELAQILAIHGAETMDHLDRMSREHEKIMPLPAQITAEINQSLARPELIALMGPDAQGQPPRYRDVVDRVAALEAMDLPDPDAWQKRKSELEAAARQAARLVETLSTPQPSEQGIYDPAAIAALDASLARLDEEEASLRTLLPAGHDLPRIIGDYERAQQQLSGSDTSALASDLERQIGALEKALEDAGPLAELDRLAGQAHQAHRQRLDEYAALGRIRDRLQRLLADEQDRAPGQVREGIEQAVGRLTGGVFSVGGFDGHTSILPERFIRQGMGAYSLGHLSQGTADTLGLAIRLTLADGYLGPEGGFLFLDDVMVNMDEERATLAIDYIKAFASRHQVIYLTCHPSTAARLGGKLHTLCVR